VILKRLSVNKEKPTTGPKIWILFYFVKDLFGELFPKILFKHVKSSSEFYKFLWNRTTKMAGRNYAK
jgi:hypothetical protein